MPSNKIVLGIKRISQSVRWRLGLPVAAIELEMGTDESVASFYNGRVTDCLFLNDPQHYEYPRARWILERVRGGRVLEIGCGNGGMTRLIAQQADHVTALDVSGPSLEAVKALGLKNVETVGTLLEHYQPKTYFEWIVMSEVLEHLRNPQEIVKKCMQWLAPGGSLLLTTPNGHWESDEHLHEFSLESFTRIIAQTEAESFYAAYQRDAQDRRRWLTGQVTKAKRPAAWNDFEDKARIAKSRRSSSK